MRTTEEMAAMRAKGLAARRAGTPRRQPPMSPLRAIRQKCLDCCGGRQKVVKYCTLDGVNSTKCALWPFRFGKRIRTARKRLGEQFLDPQQMPDANADLESLPG